jgi:para-nitrobenzyl esterase
MLRRSKAPRIFVESAEKSFIDHWLERLARCFIAATLGCRFLLTGRVIMAVVETTTGPIEGREKDGTLLFAGIPYAAPPVGERRFKAAEPHEAWRDVRPAKRFGPAAPQTPTGGLTASAAVRWDEDCLTLNVCTPAADNGQRPVLFWIHGGGYRTGQGAIPWYSGTRFAQQGNLVVVSINYRMGAFGFLDLSAFGSEYATSGVNGLLDQIVALRWVRDNIARFGGDPAKVTIAGESAGGFAVSTLLASPEAKGLFRGAIPQSGGAHHTLPKAAGEFCTEKLMAELGAQSPEALSAVDAQVLLDAQNKVGDEIGEGFKSLENFGVAVSAFYPVQGNVVVPKDPLLAIAEGASNGVPVLTGSNQDETTLWGYGDVSEESLERAAQTYGADAVLKTYQHTRPHATPSEQMIALTTDHMFRIPAVRLLEARLAADANSRNWMYWFCWKSRAFEGRLGATHALEIPFAFDNLDKAGVDIFIGPGDRPQHVADIMHQHWISFVSDLNPSWAPYTLEERSVMRYDDSSEVVLDPDGEERVAWDGAR